MISDTLMDERARDEIEAKKPRRMSKRLRSAIEAMAGGMSREVAAETFGIHPAALAKSLEDSDVQEFYEAERHDFRQGYRDVAFRKLLEMAGVIEDVPGAEDDRVRFDALIHALGILGDSPEIELTKMRSRMNAERLDALKEEKRRLRWPGGPESRPVSPLVPGPLVTYVTAKA